MFTGTIKKNHNKSVLSLKKIKLENGGGKKNFGYVFINTEK